jgi:predicted DNA-binding transcriptional regulator AlpA
MAQQDDEIERLRKKGVKFLLTDRDVALMLGFKPSAMRQRRYKHPETLPPSIQIGRVHRYDPDEVPAWIAQQKQQGRG